MQTATLHNEKEWLMLAAQGDEAAFTRLFYAYHNKLGAYILRLTESHEITEEIVQEVFIKIWTNREKLSAVNRFGSYLYVLSRNHTLNRLRQLAKKRIKERELSEKLKRANEANNSIEPAPDYYQLLDIAVEKLPPQQKKAYIYSRRERLKYEEIASRMNISRETVKKYLQLATRSVANYVRTHADMLMVIIFALLLSYI